MLPKGSPGTQGRAWSAQQVQGQVGQDTLPRARVPMAQALWFVLPAVLSLCWA